MVDAHQFAHGPFSGLVADRRRGVGLVEKIDEAVMHRVAEATIRELAESIAKRLEVSLG